VVAYPRREGGATAAAAAGQTGRCPSIVSELIATTA